MTRLVFNLSPVPLFVINSSEMKKILNGEVIPTKYLQGCLVTNPSLEDYALPEKSPIAKEVDEFPSVLEYIQEHGLQDFSFDKPVYPQPTVAPSEIPAEPIAVPETIKSSSNPGKRAQAEAEIWEPARNVAIALWSENDQLNITDVVRRIKKMPLLKASKLSESAIHKRIADLAPPNIGGKSGRKPNKPS